MHVQLSLLPGALLILVAVRVSVGKEESRASSPFYIEFLKMRLECNDYEKLKGYQRIMRIAMFGRGWLGYRQSSRIAGGPRKERGWCWMVLGCL